MSVTSYSPTTPTANQLMSNAASSSGSSGSGSSSSGASSSSGSSSSGSSSNSSSSNSSSQIGLTSTQFLSLLATQLQNQDPLNPTDPNQFTTEMVQYASLSQQIDTNTSLTSMSQTLSSLLTQVSLLAGTPSSSSGSSSGSNSSSNPPTS